MQDLFLLLSVVDTGEGWTLVMKLDGNRVKEKGIESMDIEAMHP